MCHIFSIADLKTNHHCDYNWLNKGYQENVLQPLQPRSIYDTIIDLGHRHLLDIVPAAPPQPLEKKGIHEDGVTSKLCVIS